MNEQNEKKDVLENEAVLSSAKDTEQTDNGVIFLPDDGPEDISAEENQQKLFAEIQNRPSNDNEYVIPERTFWQKVDNFCFRNKPLIIVAVVAVIIVAYLVYSAWPQSYDGDLTVIVSSSDYPTSITYEVQHELEKYAEDINNDGEKTLDVADYNTAGSNGFIVMANYMLVQEQLNGDPRSMLLVIDRELYDMIIISRGEEIFESFEGAPLWIELTCNETINTSIELGETPRLGICLLRMTDELSRDEDLCASYESAHIILTNLREAHPEMFEAGEE